MRDVGFYWVCVGTKDIWQPAFFSKEENAWLVCGTNRRWKDEELCEIGTERIQEPSFTRY